MNLSLKCQKVNLVWLDALAGGDTAYTIAPDWREQLQDDDVEVFKSEEEIRALLETLQITSDKDGRHGR